MTIRPMSRSPASPWVRRFIGGIRSGGRILDVACGAGRHLALGLSLGFRMVGIDRDIRTASATFGGHPGLDLIEADLEAGRPWPFPPASFDGVIVTSYLWRPILPDIVAAVAADGVLVYETFGVGNAAFGKPSNPDFLLRPGELLQAVHGRLRVVAFEHATLAEPPRVVQRIAAVGPAHAAWLERPPAP